MRGAWLEHDRHLGPSVRAQVAALERIVLLCRFGVILSRMVASMIAPSRRPPDRTTAPCATGSGTSASMRPAARLARRAPEAQTVAEEQAPTRSTPGGSTAIPTPCSELTQPGVCLRFPGMAAILTDLSAPLDGGEGHAGAALPLHGRRVEYGARAKPAVEPRRGGGRRSVRHLSASIRR